jgi:hypothetical protein
MEADVCADDCTKRLFYGAIREDHENGFPVEGYYESAEAARADFDLLGEVAFVFEPGVDL